MKHEFPIFSRTIHGKPLTYLDNAASTQNRWRSSKRWTTATATTTATSIAACITSRNN